MTENTIRALAEQPSDIDAPEPRPLPQWLNEAAKLVDIINKRFPNV